MITTKFYLDSRHVKDGKPSSLKLAITYNQKAVYFPLKIKLLPNCWDNVAQKILRVPNKDSLMSFILEFKNKVDKIIFSFVNKNYHFNDVNEVKAAIETELKGKPIVDENLFCNYFLKFSNRKLNNTTKNIYLFTLKRIHDFDKDIDNKRFEDINKGWLTDFENHLALTSNSKNGRNVHLRNIRAVFNDAIDNEITTHYPFRTFKIRPVQTRKRSLTVIELRMLLIYPVEPYLKRYVDLFMLDFYLIGINMIDLLNATHSSIVNGRLEYKRAKTSRFYSIKIEPEAIDIITKYKGVDYLLNILDDYRNYKDFLERFNKNLKRIGEVSYDECGKKTVSPLFPELSTYWARHTWATIASQLDISRDVIAHALGHGNNTVTDIYIKFDYNKVDSANRKVIDFVLSF